MRTKWNFMGYVCSSDTPKRIFYFVTLNLLLVTAFSLYSDEGQVEVVQVARKTDCISREKRSVVEKEEPVKDSPEEQEMHKLRNKVHLLRSKNKDLPRFDMSTQDLPTDGAVITLFTSFKEQAVRRAVHGYTIQNWGALRPYLQPVMFTKTTDRAQSQVVDMGLDHGWDVRVMPAENTYGTPYLNAMFKEVYNNYDSLFYGFANGDILFSKDLLYTLKSLWDIRFNQPIYHLMSPLVIGQRRPFIIENTTDFSLNIWEPDVLQKYGYVLPTDISCAIDYFITTRHGFPWDKIPQLVIGRCYYDLYLPIMATYYNLSTVDATQTIRNVHMQGLGNTMTHYSDHNKDEKVNFNEISSYGRMPYRFGCVDKSKLQTTVTNGSVQLQPNMGFRMLHDREIARVKAHAQTFQAKHPT